MRGIVTMNDKKEADLLVKELKGKWPEYKFEADDPYPDGNVLVFTDYAVHLRVLEHVLFFASGFKRGLDIAKERDRERVVTLVPESSEPFIIKGRGPVFTVSRKKNPGVGYFFTGLLNEKVNINGTEYVVTSIEAQGIDTVSDLVGVVVRESKGE